MIIGICWRRLVDPRAPSLSEGCSRSELLSGGLFTAAESRLGLATKTASVARLAEDLLLEVCHHAAVFAFIELALRVTDRDGLEAHVLEDEVSGCLLLAKDRQHDAILLEEPLVVVEELTTVVFFRDAMPH